jgi:hypothetical protein
VPIRIEVANLDSQPRDLYLRGRDIAFDISISDASGRTFWRRLEGEIIPAIIQLRTLGPGESFTLVHHWDQKNKRGKPAPTGVYRVRAEVLTDGSASLAATEMPLVIEP